MMHQQLMLATLVRINLEAQLEMNSYLVPGCRRNSSHLSGISEGLGLLSKEENMVMPGFIVLFLVCLPLIWSHMFTFLSFKCKLHHLPQLGSQHATLRESLLEH